MGMFCFQCQETAMNKGCTIKGVCGKEPATAGLMDVLIYAVRGGAIVNRALRAKGAAGPERRRSGRQGYGAGRQIRPRDHFDRGKRHEKPDL
ncbi:hypothetical protein [Alistipes senegalensis]|uniref:hypothetical protein n=1 Tax=Alistipes senegalensis TaxID=1288121 RepID=UPI0039779DD0